MQQQKMYRFRRLALHLCTVSVYERVKYSIKLSAAIKARLGSASYVYKQVMLLFARRWSSKKNDHVRPRFEKN